MKLTKSHVTMLDMLAASSIHHNTSIPTAVLARLLVWTERRCYRLLDDLETERLVGSIPATLIDFAKDGSGILTHAMKWRMTEKGEQWLRQTIL